MFDKKTLKNELLKFYTNLEIDKYSSIGWYYSDVMESKYVQEIETANKKINESYLKKKNKEKIKQDYFNIDLLNLINEDDIENNWQKLKRFIKYHNSNSLQDDFINSSDNKYKILNEFISDSRKLNILVYGSGICGLFFSHTLKKKLGEFVNIIVYDNRIKSHGTLKSFSRDWLTYLPLKYFKGKINEDLFNLINKFSYKKFIGLPIYILETLFFLHCKLQGTKFMFREYIEIDKINKHSISLIIDATGGRFDYKSKKKAEIQNHFISQFNFPSVSGRTISLKSREISLKKKDGYFFPMKKNFIYNVPQIKITNITNKNFEVIKKYLDKVNKKSLFYSWQGALPPKINNNLVIINLEKKYYNNLLRVVNSKTTLNSFIKKNNIKDFFCDETINFLSFLENIDDFREILLEPPFIYQPKFKDLNDFSSLNSNFVIPVGDSLFNGNVKCSNGLHKHLPIINSLNSKISNIILEKFNQLIEKSTNKLSNNDFTFLQRNMSKLINEIWH